AAPPAAPLPAARAGPAARSPPRATAPARPAAPPARRGCAPRPPRHRRAGPRTTRRAAQSDRTEVVDFSPRSERFADPGHHAKAQERAQRRPFAGLVAVAWAGLVQ